MRKTIFITYLVAASALFPITQASAQQDCILSKAGNVICGDAANAERDARREEKLRQLRAEGSLPGIVQVSENRPSASKPLGISAPENQAQNPTARPAPKKKAAAGSIYQSFGQRVSQRSGYVFSSSREGADGSPSAGVFSAAYIHPIKRFGNHLLSAEVETIYYRDADIVSALGIDVVSREWSLTGLLSARYQYSTGWIVDPFATFGVGTAFTKTALTTAGVRNSDDAFVFAYGGRAGLIAHVTNNLAIEGGYRFLGSTFDGSSNIQAVEVGVNLGF